MPPRPIRRALPEPDPQPGGGDVNDFDLAAPDGSDVPPARSPSGARILQANDDSADIYDFNGEAPAALTDDPNDPDANLAMQMDASDLDAIGAELLDKIEEDRRSSQQWFETLAKGIEMLGFTYEERTYPFKGASGAYDPMMAEAVYRCQAKARAALLPPAGPVKTQLVGAETDQALDQASRVKAWMNLYLTELAPEYYTEFDQMLFWWSLGGSIFKKVYQDPILARPVAPFIMPEKFVVAYGTKSLDSCVRATHEAELSQREVKLRQLEGLWLDTDMGEPDAGLAAVYGGSTLGENPVRLASDQAEGLTNENAIASRSKYIGDAAWEIPECHVDLDLSSLSNRPDPQVPAGLPVPYRVTIARNSRKILAINRNWIDGDPMYAKRQWFIHYKLLPGPGFYGAGFAHLLNNPSRTGTALTRQIIDGVTLSMFTGGFRAKGMKIENNNLMIGPCEWPELDTGGQDIRTVFAPMPVKEVSPVSLDTLKFNSDRAQQIANTVDIAVGDGRQDAPVGTTVALMEAANVMSSVMIMNAHVSLRREFQAFHRLFGEHLPEEPYPFPVRATQQNPAGMATIMRADFTPTVAILPVSDPNITSSSQRIMRAQVIGATGNQYPDIFSRRAIARETLEAMNLDDERIDKLMPPPQQGVPSDPLTENQMALAGAPLMAAAYQDHQAHIMVHQTLAQLPAMQAHIAEHIAMQMRAKVEATIGATLPQSMPGRPLPPQLENQVAMLTARAMQQMKQQQGNSITQDQIVQAEMAIEAQKLQEKAQASQTKASAEVFKSQLQFQSDERDRAVRLRLGELQAASGTAGKQNPPADYVKTILDLANQEIPGTNPADGSPMKLGVTGAAAALAAAAGQPQAPAAPNPAPPQAPGPGG